jgi:hypothetical protein
VQHACEGERDEQERDVREPRDDDADRDGDEERREHGDSEPDEDVVDVEARDGEPGGVRADAEERRMPEGREVADPEEKPDRQAEDGPRDALREQRHLELARERGNGSERDQSGGDERRAR